MLLELFRLQLLELLRLLLLLFLGRFHSLLVLDMLLVGEVAGVAPLLTTLVHLPMPLEAYISYMGNDFLHYLCI